MAKAAQAIEKYKQRAADSLLCVGLDSRYDRLPEHFLRAKMPQFAFNRWIIEQTHPYVCAYKPNIAFYEARGTEGLAALKQTMDYLKAKHPDILTICDAKRADIGTTNEGYAAAIFDWLGFDAVTLNPYLGREALVPFLARADKGCILLCRTSNPGAGEFQDLVIDGKALWQIVAERVSRAWNTHGNCMLVAGATYPAELARIRQIVGTMPLLVPGIGAQGGDIGAVMQAGLTADRGGMIINASRAVIFAGDPEEAARSLCDTINDYR